MKDRSPIKKISDKRAAKHPNLRFSTIAPKPKPVCADDLVSVGQTYLPKSAIPVKRVKVVRKGLTLVKPRRIAKKPRTPAEFKRIYGTKERQAWMRHLPCHFCGYTGATQICHAKTGGMGRKDDAKRTWPGCGPHWEFGLMPTSLNGVGFQLVRGCHNRPYRSEDLLIIAAEYEAKWQAHLASKAGT